MDASVRLVTEDDVAPLTALLRANREFLTPWEPARTDAFFTENYQRRLITEHLSSFRHGRIVPMVIIEDTDIAGRITINEIVRGAFQSGHLGYWVGQPHTGRGVATAAVAAVLQLAFDRLALHRMQAGTLLHNFASQRVLLRNGFKQIGQAPEYVQIAGRWQEHVLFQRINEHYPEHE